MIDLKPKTIDMLRDMAIKMEENDLETARDLMYLAHISRPNGPFIKKKLDMYDEKLRVPSSYEQQLKQMVENGEIALIPIGFRCFTKITINKLLKISQASLPFDSGFFPPSSVISLFKNPHIELKFSKNYMNNHSVCVKFENYNDQKLGKGIKFQKSSYDQINALVTNPEMQNVNSYLDSTFGYYTLDLKHNFVLAHYNWHKFADVAKSKNIVDPKINLEAINNTMTRRIERMFRMCQSAKYIFFIYMENQEYNYMMIDDVSYDLNDYSSVESYVRNKFTAKTYVKNINEINSAEKILETIKRLETFLSPSS